MFGKKKEQPVIQEVVEQKAPEISANKTVIGCGITMEGTFEGTDPIEVNGTIKGTVLSESEVYVAKSGQLFGNGRINVLNVDGKVDGNFECRESATFNAGGKMKGKLSTKNLVTAAGSGFAGELAIIPEEEPEEAPAAVYEPEEAE